MRYFLLGLFSVAALLAQSNASDAAMDGYINDPAGTRIPGAQVAARNTGTNVELTATTNEQGYYRFPLLKVGDYELRVSATGFSEFRQSGIILTVGKQARLDVTLKVGALTDSVTVNADAAIVDPGKIAQGIVMDEKEVRSLPITSRNVYNFHLLGPGVKGIPSTGFGTTQFTFGGSNRSTWTVDGLDNTARRNARQIRLVISTPESVQEMQVISGAYSAEFGRAAGGVINVVSRSGTNDLHGSGMGLYRPLEATARAPLAAVRADQSWYMVAGNLSGALKRDRLWYFINDEFNPLKQPQPVTILAANATALNLPASDLGNSPFGETFHTPSGKLNYKLNEKNSGFIRYNRFTNDQPGGGGGLTTISRSLSFEDRMNGGAAQLATILSPNLLNEFRFGVNRRAETRETYVPGQANGAQININNVANFGVNPLAGSGSVEASTQFIDNLSWTRGRHTLKTGIDYQTTNFDVRSALTRLFSFNGLAAVTGVRGAVTPLDQYLNTTRGAVDPATQRPYTYTQLSQDIGENNIRLRFHFVNLFLQDEYRVNSRLTLNLGVRYELILFPVLDDQAPYELSRRINNDKNNIAPRIGLSYSPFQDGKTVIRAGYGLFYDSPSLSLVSNGAQVNGRRILNYTVPGTDARAPVFPNLLATTDPAFQTPPNVTAFPRDFQVMYAHNASLQIERQIFQDLSLNLQYSYWGHRFGAYARDINLSAPVSTLADGRPVYRGSLGRPDPRFRQINLIESGGISNYNGLDITLRKRFQKGILLSASYSWSHALADTELDGTTISDPSNRRRDYGNASTDVRHNFTAQGLYAPSFRFFRGFEFSSVFFYNSGYPINAQAGADLNNDLILNDRMAGRGRNAFPGPDFAQMDVRLARKIRFRERHTLELIAESENFFNRFNPGCSIASCTAAVVNRDGAADFGRITATRPGRVFQFGMRYSF
ncbi:MAG: TonB-dependent receptor [Bryobacteraceae bacterium]|nr:TonB-dependent receptor [Bryobacteraceae bacterium]